MKKPDETYQDILAYAKTGKVSRFKRKFYKISVAIGLESFNMRPVILFYATNAGLNLTGANGLDRRWLNNIRQLDIQEIRNAFNTKVNVSVTIALHLQVSDSHTWVTFGEVDRLTVLILLETTFIQKFIKDIHPIERNVFADHFLPYTFR